jgi:peptide/nickel transport system permease protein
MPAETRSASARACCSTATSAGASGARRRPGFRPLVIILLVLSAFAAPLIAPQNPYDLKSDLHRQGRTAADLEGQDGEAPFLLGTDPQGRDVLSTILYGTRVSLIIGLASVADVDD